MMTRDYTLDILKGIGILLVVFAHTYHGELTDDIYLFHMPLFFIASGCMYALGKDGTIRRKMCSIVVPYFCFSLLSFLYWLLIEARFRPMPEHGIFDEWLPNVSIPMQQFLNIFIACDGEKAFIYNVVLWFLPCLFVSHCIYHYINRCKPAIQIGGGITLALIYKIVDDNVSTLPWYADIAMLSVPFMIIGRWTYSVLHNRCKERAFIYISLVVSAVLFFLLASVSGERLNMMGHNIPAPWWLYTIPCCGYLMTYSLSAVFCEYGGKAKDILVWLGRNSLLIMCLHEPVKRIVIKGYAIVSHLDTEEIRELLPYSLLIVFTTVIICVPLVFAINKWLPWMTGRMRISENMCPPQNR